MKCSYRTLHFFCVPTAYSVFVKAIIIETALFVNREFINIREKIQILCKQTFAFSKKLWYTVGAQKMYTRRKRYIPCSV